MVSVDPSGTGTVSERPRRPVPTSASYSITVRLQADPDPAVVGRIATAIGDAGGIVTAIDVAESRHDRITVDVTCSAVNGEHADEIVAALGAVDGVAVHKVSDRTFLLHLGGKIETAFQGAAADPRRPVDGVHAGRRAGLPRAGRATPTTCAG